MIKRIWGGVAAGREPSPVLVDMKNCTETWQLGSALKAGVLACFQTSRGRCGSGCRWCRNNPLLLLNIDLADQYWEESLEATRVQVRQARAQVRISPGSHCLVLLCLYFVSGQKLWLTMLLLKKNSRFQSFKPNLNLVQKAQTKADQTDQSWIGFHISYRQQKP